VAGKAHGRRLLWHWWGPTPQRRAAVVRGRSSGAPSCLAALVMRNGTLLWMLWVLLLGACRPKVEQVPATQVVVRIEADPEVRAVLAQLRVRTASEQNGRWVERNRKTFAQAALKWPVDIVLTPRMESEADRPFEVIVEALRADERVLVQARVLTAFVLRETRVLPLQLARCGDQSLGFLCDTEECLGPECETCVNGRCASTPFVRPESLAPFTPPGDADDDVTPPGDADDGSDAGPELCDLSACAPEATCKLSGEEAVCACPPGYWGDGTSCTRDECHPEQGSACGEHTSCEDPSPEPGDFTCTCEHGYADCDDNLVNCGACGEACAGDLACVEGRCEQAAAALVLGANMTCALLEPADARGARRLRCWGSNASNRLRTGNTSENAHTPIAVAGLERVRAIAVGDQHACALDDDSDAIYCWGRNDHYELGTKREDVTDGELIHVGFFRGAAEIGAGGGSTCVRAAGRILCWGSNRYGQLGAPDLANTAVAREISGIVDAVQLKVSGLSSCARRANGRITCWGGVFPDGPQDIADASGRPIEDFVHLAVGVTHACGVRASGEMGCWGGNDSAQLGTGIGPSRTHYVKVPGLDDVIDAAAGAVHTCAIVKSGQVSCWGANYTGLLATTSSANPIEAPTPVPTLTNAIDIEAGVWHICARLRSGQVVCWGENLDGELGDGTAIVPSGPVKVVSLP
jgi:hypothetical protein